MVYISTYHILITGIVQGVGFRPFIHNLARRLKLQGWVKNSSKGVEISITCDDNSLENFKRLILLEAPPLSHILDITVSRKHAEEFSSFEIKESEGGAGNVLVPPDIAICKDCLKELSDKRNRRYLYPFINCTNCGPRYSIIKTMPYDRTCTSMNNFKMCSKCSVEYNDPWDRRFHAQPNCCEVCGPEVYLEDLANFAAIQKTGEFIDSGDIVAVKGLGGYHIMCDATSNIAVKKLREIKMRHAKPFAIMAKDIESLERFVTLSAEEKLYLTSPQAPILVIYWKGEGLSPFVNPINNKIGIMLAYTPLHRLIMECTKTDFIIATSGNLKDEPISKTAEEAEKNLSTFTKHFLHHNREIFLRVDDSVATIVKKNLYILRRARGFAPYPIMLKEKLKKTVLGLGAHFKNSVCLAYDNYAFVSQYIGDLNNVETTDFYQEVITHMINLFGQKPEVLLTDLHPDYFSTRFRNILDFSAESISVQHHEAHFYACMAEHGIMNNVMGVVFDGTGLGTDGNIWGGEIFVLKDKIIRSHHLEVYKQPGMDSAAKNPYRMLISYLVQTSLIDKYESLILDVFKIEKEEVDLIRSIVKNNINCIYTSSAGRLFESIGALLSGIKSNEFQAHSAIVLESMCDADIKGIYDFNITQDEIGLSLIFEQLLLDMTNGVNNKVLATKLHNTIAEITRRTCNINRKLYDIHNVVLTGGVFQNIFLINKTIELLQKDGFNVYIHSRVPSNDGCISLGQIYYYLLNFNHKKISKHM